MTISTQTYGLEALTGDLWGGAEIRLLEMAKFTSILLA